MTKHENSALRKRLINAEQKLEKMRDAMPQREVTDRGCKAYMRRFYAQREKRDALLQKYDASERERLGLDLVSQIGAYDVERILADELRWANEKHPEFSTAFGPQIIMEELGEVAQLYNDYGDGKITLDELRKKATVETAHVAVTAIRLLCNLCKGQTK